MVSPQSVGISRKKSWSPKLEFNFGKHPGITTWWKTADMFKVLHIKYEYHNNQKFIHKRVNKFHDVQCLHYHKTKKKRSQRPANGAIFWIFPHNDPQKETHDVHLPSYYSGRWKGVIGITCVGWLKTLGRGGCPQETTTPTEDGTLLGGIPCCSHSHAHLEVWTYTVW